MRRAIQRLIEDPLSEQLLEGRWSSGSVIDVDVEDDKLVFNAGTGSIPAPRKRDTIAAEAELLLAGYDLGHGGYFFAWRLFCRRPGSRLSPKCTSAAALNPHQVYRSYHD